MMEKQAARDLRESTVDEADVVQYLQAHADLFERHPQLLLRMRVQHARNGTTISLIERQVDVLREKIRTQDENLASLVRVARDNHALAEKFHALTRRLLRGGTRVEGLEAIATALANDFGVSHSVLALLPPWLPATSPSAGERPFTRAADDSDPVFRSFESLFSSGKPRCGQARDSQCEYLFGADAIQIRSVALVPVHQAATGKSMGVLGLGSTDRNHFRPDMSTDFLARLGDVISDILVRGDGVP